MVNNLNAAAENGLINELYRLLAQDPNLLDHLDKKPFVETPVHVAASAGKAHFAIEVASLKPSLASKLNLDGSSPMHLALEKGHIETVRGLLTVDSNLVRVKGKDAITPLHVAAKLGRADIVAEFLSYCPASIEDLTPKRQTAVHVATEKGEIETLSVLFGWLCKESKEEIMNWKDEEGNTALHLAIQENSPKAAELLINNVDISAKNNQRDTALDKEMTEILSQASPYSSFMNSLVRKRDRYLGGREHFNTDIRNIILVVAVLIATSAYQAMLSPPGGYWGDDSPPVATLDHQSPGPSPDDGQRPHRAGKMTMEAWASSYFALLNSTAFSASVCTIIILVMGLPFAFLLEASTLFISCAYFVSLLTIFPSFDSPTFVMLCLFAVILGAVHFVAFDVDRRQRDKRSEWFRSKYTSNIRKM